MKLTFFGAARGVTGSCALVETVSKKFLVDCGMFQGTLTEQILNYEKFPFKIEEIDFVILTHAHIDHCGRIPQLYTSGYRNSVYATKATCDLGKIMLPDSGHIQEKEIEWVNRKRMRAGKKPELPIYTAQDGLDACELYKPVDYNENVEIDENITFKFIDAGHMLGSAVAEVWITENGKTEKIVFSGDLGNEENPIICNPQKLDSADTLILESTYGGRLHGDVKDQSQKFIDILLSTIERGGNVIIPSFAVGRTQEILFEINKYVENNQDYIARLARIPVVVDSPLATHATEIFEKNPEFFNETALNYVLKGDNPMDFKNLRFTLSADESRALNEDPEPKIIISASGMCEAGRIKHHLKWNLWRPESTILFVGYQAEGTLGRRLVSGEKIVKIFGEEIGVNAKIEFLDAFSGHADQKGLIDWIDNMDTKPKNIFLVHGEYENQLILASVISSKFGIECIIPERSETYEFRNGKPEKSQYVDSNVNLRLQVHEILSYLKQDVDTMTNIVKFDMKKGASEEELYKIKGMLNELREKIMIVKGKED